MTSPPVTPPWQTAMVAIFPDCRSTKPSGHLPVLDVLMQVLCPTPEIAALIAQVRAATTKAERDRLKEHLPGIVFAADLHHRQHGTPLDDKIISLSGVAGMDLDELPDPVVVRDSLIGDPFVAAAFLSPSGTGVKVLVRFAKPERFADCWRAAATYFATSYGLKVDPSPKAVTSLCFLSADPDLFVSNEEVAAFQPMATEIVAQSVDPAAAESSGPLLPGEDFNRRPELVPGLLMHHGWTLVRNGDNQLWRRPGKEVGWSATFNGTVFYVFSSSAAPFQASTGYSPFALVALLEHGGDFSAAASALRSYGFGGTADDDVDLTLLLAKAAERPGKARLKITCFRDTVERRPEWLWKGYLLRGATAVLGGRPGNAKGLCTADIAARLTRGGSMPDGSGGGTPTKVLFVTAEDDPEMTMVRRLRIAGADKDLVFWTHGEFEDETRIRTIAEGAEAIERTVVEQGIGLVIFDPISAWIEEDANNSQQIRAVIDPMNRMARRTGCAVLFVAHLRKASAEEPMDAFAGSVQVTAACRTAMLITCAGNSLTTDTNPDRLLQVVKTNFRKPDHPMIFQLARVSVDDDDPPKVVWRNASGDDLAADAAARQGKTPIVPAAAVLPLLKPEHRPLKDVARAIRKELLPNLPGISVQAVVDALKELVASGQAHEGSDAHRGRTIGLAPAPAVETATDRVIAYWEQHPEASQREIASACGCSVALVDKARRLLSRSTRSLVATPDDASATCPDQPTSETPEDQ